MWKRPLLASVLSFFLVLSSQAQAVETDRGYVEFIGLDAWTTPQLVDTLRAISPNKSLHACAADLKHTLGFADASVISFFQGEGEYYTVVTVVEPQEAHRIQYLDTPPDTLESVAAWKTLIEFSEEKRRQFSALLQSYDGVLAGQRDSVLARMSNRNIDRNTATTFYDALQERTTKADYEQALWTLANDGNVQNRAIAAVVLMNFSDSDLTWWQLVHALRDSDSRVRFTAMAALNTLTKHDARPVDWSPAAPSIRHLLRGTNLFALNTVVTVLTKTKIDPAVAQNILDPESSDLIVDYLSAQHEPSRQLARDFLAQASGQDYDSPDAWMQWLEQIN